METSEVITVLKNMTDSCKEIKKVAKLNDTLVFTDIEARQVKRYNPSTKKVKETNHLKEDTATNGPQGTVSKDTNFCRASNE